MVSDCLCARYYSATPKKLEKVPVLKYLINFERFFKVDSLLFKKKYNFNHLLCISFLHWNWQVGRGNVPLAVAAKSLLILMMLKIDLILI